MLSRMSAKGKGDINVFCVFGFGRCTGDDVDDGLTTFSHFATAVCGRFIGNFFTAFAAFFDRLLLRLTLIVDVGRCLAPSAARFILKLQMLLLLGGPHRSTIKSLFSHNIRNVSISISLTTVAVTVVCLRDVVLISEIISIFTSFVRIRSPRIALISLQYCF